MVKHRQPTDLLFFHQLGRLSNVLILETVDEVGGHYVTHLNQCRVTPRRGRPHRNVAVSKEADQLIAVTDRQDADVERAHLLGDFLQQRLRAHDLRVVSHYFFHSHSGPRLKFFSAQRDALALSRRPSA